MNYDLKIFTQNIEPVAVNQIYEMISQSAFVNQKIRIMPDVHSGAGCVVGFTSTMGDKFIPNVIGVDIGCGMRIVTLGNININYKELDDFIKSNIPAGSEYCKEENGKNLIESLYVYKELRDMERLLGSIGSLGGGNHFIEIDVDQNGGKYLVIHTGSRNLGMQVASIYQKLAYRDCKDCAIWERERVCAELKAQGRVAEIPTAIKQINEQYAYKSKTPKEYCYLEGTHLNAYLHDMKICQEFAKLNREKIAQKILKFLKLAPKDYFESIHNYIDENNIIRKGAISAKAGERVLIPLNMRDGCILGYGLGNEDWNYSAPHGAGRLYSRSDSKALFTVEEFLNEMKGIYTTTAKKSTLDESPMAYKPTAEIQNLIVQTVKIHCIIKPEYNFKAAN